MSAVVLDASAVIAWLNEEPGSDRVDAHIGAGAVISSVNLAEVLSKVSERGGDVDRAAGQLAALMTVQDFTQADALSTGHLRPLTRVAGLSFGDRACLALGSRLKVPVLTADRAWATLSLPDISVETIR